MPRQTIYERDNWDEKLELIKGWARDGLTDKQIADNMGISKDTFYKYKKRYSDFADTLKKGKEVVDYEVENALLKSALSGNVTAMIFWLKNRKRTKWRDKPEPERGKDKKTKPLHERLEAIRSGDNNASN